MSNLRNWSNLTRRMPTHQEMHDIMRSLGSRTDREAVIVSHGLVEKAVERFLAAMFVGLTDGEKDELLGGAAPLATHSARMNLLYALGVLSGHLRDNLYIANKLRNLFAHAVEEFTFETPEVLEKLKLMDFDFCSEIENPLYNLELQMAENYDSDSEDVLIIMDRYGFVLVRFERLKLGEGGKREFLWSMAQIWTLLTNLTLAKHPDAVQMSPATRLL